MQMGKASAVKRPLQYSVVMKRELSKKAKLLVFKTVFIPILQNSFSKQFFILPTVMSFG